MRRLTLEALKDRLIDAMDLYGKNPTFYNLETVRALQKEIQQKERSESK